MRCQNGIRDISISVHQSSGGSSARCNAEFTIWRGVLGPKEMGKDEIAYWDKTFKELSEKEEWKKLLAEDGVESEYKSAADFKPFLDEQEKLIKEILDVLGMSKN